MKAFKPYFQVCFKYDPHWNPTGAFIGTQTLYRELGLSNTDLRDVKVTSSMNKVGDIFGIGGLDKNKYPDDYDYTVHYRTDLTPTTVFHSNDRITITECANATNKKNIVLFGDSFRHAMTPYLQKDFTRCTIVHRDLLCSNMSVPVSSYDANMVREVKNANILVVCSVERYDYNIIGQAKELIKILNSN